MERPLTASAARPDFPVSGSLAVVMPAYNEAAVIDEAVSEVKQAVLSRTPGSKLIVVDDGSRDGTGTILDRLAAADTRITVIHQNNRGHGSALLTGLDHATATWILLIDSDRQIPLDAFERAWALRNGYQAVLGARTGRDDPLVRRLITAVLRLALRTLLAVDLSDPNVPFKLLRLDVVQRARRLIPDGTSVPSVFLSAFIVQRGLAFAVLPVPYRQRQAGQGSLQSWRLWKFALRAMLELAAFSIRLRRPSATPAVSQVTDRAA
jgi:dolichol-phosphate mannosyltransferase